MNVQIQVDTSGLAAGIAAAKKYSKRTMPEICNTSAYWIAVNAKNEMPFVTPQMVDTELGTVVSTTTTIGKTGKARKRTVKLGRRMGSITKSAPIAALIIQARSNYNSNYNRLTKHRWALQNSPFAGKTRSAGRAAMQRAVNKLINVRHSAGKFLLAGWIPAIKALKGKAIHKFSKGQPSPLEGRDSYYGTELGSATPALEAELAHAIIENAVGMEGQNAKSYNDALLRFGMPGLQAAIDREGTQQMNYALKKMEQELAGQVTKAWR